MKLSLGQPAINVAKTPADSTPAPGAAVEPVLLVHGTFANKGNRELVDWWRPGSAFCRDLDARLLAHGSPAKCWAEPALRERRCFAWSGYNSEQERLKAGRALANQLATLERDDAIGRYHVVSHSHGGNVMLHALRELREAPRKLGEVIFLGTPVLQFKHFEMFDPRWITLPLLVAALGGTVWGFWQSAGDNRWLWGTAILAVALAMVLDLLRSGLPRRRPEAELYGSGRPRAFMFGPDEAFTALTLAHKIIQNPGKFIDQFREPEKAAGWAVLPSEAPSGNDAFRDSGPQVLFQSLYQAVQPSQPYQTGLAASATARTDLPGNDRQNRVTQQIEKVVRMVPVAYLQYVLVFALAVCMLLPYLVLLVAGAFIAGAKRARRGAMMLGALAAYVAGRWSLPSLFRDAAFGIDEGRFVEVRRLPPGVAEAEPLSDELFKEAIQVSQRLSGGSGQAVLDAMVGKDPFSIKTQVKLALSDTTLVHSYYYQSPEILDRIAALIASPRGHRDADRGNITPFASGRFAKIKA